MLSYDKCLLIIKDKGINFSIARFQTNNTLNIEIGVFINKEEAEIIEAKFKAKSQIMSKTSVSKDFNKCHMTIENKSIIVIQKKQAEKLLFVDIKDNTKK